MGLRYGKFTERFRVSARTPGYKMAHLRYTPNEVDYPEAGGNFDSDPISEFTHGFSESGSDAAPNSAWTGYHTYSTEITPGHLRFYFDGKLFRTMNADFPDRADWVLQNESALAGAYAAKGSSVDVLTSWLTCYRYAP
jgi:beta-glucanase (GH16 family)